MRALYALRLYAKFRTRQRAKKKCVKMHSVFNRVCYTSIFTLAEFPRALVERSERAALSAGSTTGMHSNLSLPEETVALAAAVSRLLASQDYESAVFVGERLVAAAPQDEAARALLGEAYLRGGGGAAGGGPAAASALLRGCKSPACRFLAARAAMAREAWSEVEDSLLRGTGLAGADIATLRSSLLATGGELRLPRGAAAVALLALAAARTDRLVRAADLYKLALELDPFQVRINYSDSWLHLKKLR